MLNTYHLHHIYTHKKIFGFFCSMLTTANLYFHSLSNLDFPIHLTSKIVDSLYNRTIKMFVSFFFFPVFLFSLSLLCSSHVFFIFLFIDILLTQDMLFTFRKKKYIYKKNQLLFFFKFNNPFSRFWDMVMEIEYIVLFCNIFFISVCACCEIHFC